MNDDDDYFRGVISLGNNPPERMRRSGRGRRRSRAPLSQSWMMMMMVMMMTTITMICRSVIQSRSGSNEGKNSKGWS